MSKLLYIGRESDLYLLAVELRKNAFFKGLEDQDKLINDEDEEDGIHLIAIENNRVIGTGRFNIDGERGAISQMAVHPEFQRIGIATELMEELLKLASKSNVFEISLSARENAIPLYKKFGFKEVGGKYPSKKTGIPHQRMVYRSKSDRF